jgi:drug/metabolite transporter (DMT)-like permease
MRRRIHAGRQARVTHGNPIAYLEIVFALAATAYIFGVWKLRGAAALRAAVNPRSVVAGISHFGAYALTVAPLTLASAASVAAVRESSVVMATAWLAITGREHVGPATLTGAVAVAGGIALIALS